MDTHMYILTRGGIAEIEYILYDLKDALLKAQEMNLTVYRIRIRTNGTTTIMKIYDHSTSKS